MTILRPYIVLLSGTRRHMVMLELTVLLEDRMEEASGRKVMKHADHADERRRQRWRTCVEMAVVEEEQAVGCCSGQPQLGRPGEGV